MDSEVNTNNCLDCPQRSIRYLKMIPAWTQRQSEREERRGVGFLMSYLSLGYCRNKRVDEPNQ